MHRRIISVAAALAVGVAVTAGGAIAQSAAAKAVADRQAKFKQLGGAFKTINDQLKTGSPDKAVITAAALKMKTLAAEEASWFPKGSGPEAGVKTGAKPEIWTDAATFAGAVRGLQTETTKLHQIAAGGDLDALRAQIMPTGRACKTCHDKFRLSEK